jgi:hypothetical protein
MIYEMVAPNVYPKEYERGATQRDLRNARMCVASLLFVAGG